MNPKTRDELRADAIANLRLVLSALNDAVTDAGNDILEASKASAEPKKDNSLIPLFKILRKRERERDHARDLLTAMEASK